MKKRSKFVVFGLITMQEMKKNNNKKEFEKFYLLANELYNLDKEHAFFEKNSMEDIRNEYSSIYR